MEQNTFDFPNYCEVNGKGCVILDFGREYFGGMFKLGATSFWEGFNLEWMKNSCKITEHPSDDQKDVHGDCGECCYMGYRHSFCHGWSAGVAKFIKEHCK